MTEPTRNAIPAPTEPVVAQRKQLLGDRLEQILSKMGANKATQVYQRITKRTCNCGRRKELLNNLHRQVLGKQTTNH